MLAKQLIGNFYNKTHKNMTIEEVFTQTMDRWEDLPSEVKKKFYKMRWWYLNHPSKVGFKTKIDLIEAVNGRIEAYVDFAVVKATKPVMITKEDAFRHVCYHWDRYPKEHKKEVQYIYDLFLKRSPINTAKMNKVLKHAWLIEGWVEKPTETTAPVPEAVNLPAPTRDRWKERMTYNG